MPDLRKLIPRQREAIACVCSVLLLANSDLYSQETSQIQVRRTSENVPFGIIADSAALRTPAPTLLIFTHGLEEMQRQPVYTQVGRILAQQGWVSVVIEPPCHGEDVRPEEPAQLNGWRSRLENNDDFISGFNQKTRTILDSLIRDRISNPEYLAVCGTSRGGFLAYHYAAYDNRIKAVAGISPVTRLMALREFSTITPADKAEQWNVGHLAAKLAGRAVWLSIGNNDLRVSTDDAIAFTREVVRATSKPDVPNGVIPVELIVSPTPGHTKIDQAHERLASWLIHYVTR